MKKELTLKQLLLAAIAIVLMITACLAFKTYQDDQVSEDLKKADRNIHWPQGFSPATAELFAHNEIVIDAPVNVVFRHLLEAGKWPEWYSNAKNIVFTNSPDGLLKPGTEWNWETFGVRFKSQICEYVENSRIGWFGYGVGWKGVHTWHLVPEGNKTHLITEECVYGDAAKKMRRTNASAMHNGHENWDVSLKKISEKR